MASDVIQDNYPDETAHCYGCGRLHPGGLHLQSRWDGDETVALITPDETYVAMPGFVYGGLIASLIDCHGTGTASAAAYRAAGREMGTEPVLRFVTGRLEVDFLRPTPMGVELEVRGLPVEVKERKVVSEITVRAGGQECAKGKVVAVLAPDSMFAGGA